MKKAEGWWSLRGARCRGALLAALFVLPQQSPPRIHDVQGAAHRSPLVGRRVQGVTGIVIAVHAAGFSMQEPDATADDRPETSEGVLVYTGRAAARASSVAPGDEVSVTGTVTEYRPDARDEQLTVTELAEEPVVVVLAHGRPLPAPMLVGRAGRAPPLRLFCDDATGGDLDLGGAFDPEHDGLDFFESLEGMRVAVQDAVAIAPTSARRELWVLADDGAASAGRSARGGVVATPGDHHPERLLLDSSAQRLPDVDAGVRFPGRLIGVLGYAFGNYRIAVQSLPRPQGKLAPDVPEPPARDGELLVATFNLRNLSARTEASRVAALARQIVVDCGTPDLLAVQEVQDDSGSADDGTTSAARTLAALRAAIVAAGGPDYAAIDLPPRDGEDGGEPGGNIRCALLFRTDRGLSLVTRDGAQAHDPAAAHDTTAARSVVDVHATLTVKREADGPQLAPSPGRLGVSDEAFAHSRKPLSAEFRWRGRPLFLLVNHWNSKTSDQPLAGRHQPPVRASEVQRQRQARAVRAFADELLAADADADLIVLGDFNDASGSAALAVLTAAGAASTAATPAPLTDLGDGLAPAERSSYIHEGNGQLLDHILLSPHLLRATSPDGARNTAHSDAARTDAAPADETLGPTGAPPLPAFRCVHLNAEFHEQASDHDPCVARLSFGAGS